MIRNITDGNKLAKVVFVGEALGYEEIKQGRPLVGYSGMEFDRMLGEAGLSRRDAYITNVIHDTAPQKSFYKVKEAKDLGVAKVDGRHPHPKVLEARNAIRKELSELKPNIIVPLGDMALWAITGLSDGIHKWRGSVIESEFGKVVPTFNPAYVTRVWADRWIAVQDFRRVFREKAHPEIKKPAWNFRLRPSFDEAHALIEEVRGKEVTCDLETRGGQIACVGFAFNPLDAFCIPIMSAERTKGYWSDVDELSITLHLKDVLLDPSTKCIFQNGLYDLQYFAKQWGYIPLMSDDTMVMFHVCYPGLKKSLDFQSSLFCDYYCYWKDDGKTWNKTTGEDQLWHYNCQDCIYTYENWEILKQAIKTYRLEEQYAFQQRLFKPVLNMMLQGVRVDTKFKQRVGGELLKVRADRLDWLERVLGHEMNINSNPQMKKLFYTDLGMKEIYNRKTKSVTLDDDALELIKTRQPVFGPLINCIQEARSLRIFKSNFADANIDGDRARCSYNLTGAKTFRFSASKNAFGTGFNMQTLPKGHELEDE